MDLIIEIIAELFLEGIFAVSKGKYPLWLKIPAILILALILIATIVLFVWLGIDCILKGRFIGGTVILIIDILIIVFILKSLFKSKK